MDGGAAGFLSPGCVAAAPGVGGFLSPATLLGAVPASVAPAPAVVETETSRSVIVSFGRGESVAALLIATAVVMERLRPSRDERASSSRGPVTSGLRRDAISMRCDAMRCV